MTRPSVDKVTAFVVTSSRPRSILVFTHPTAGLQLPAGTVELGESFLDAAVREVAEETGIRSVRDGVILDTEFTNLSDGEAILCSTAEGIDDSNTGTRHTFRRGHMVRLVNHAPPRCLVAELEWNHNVNPPVVTSTKTGWVPQDAVAYVVRRAFVVFLYDGPTFGTTWTHHADGHAFEAQWTPLDTAVGFAGVQNGWIERFRGSLLVRC